ncbi:hypothetical protein ASPVEDRAFT_79602 [Aspergillus versicolor CBS 583.65]|uniref:Uncharacterized protein n=1 Tax=Aspergillus versicolor CBS 583.65 TaxID=1036611 RepID=A0A1L9P8W9_ASPVE|nr:uncharacterized protein ASPVEDRAFT_79602 [Aspergillus versicolor CBS 583.65]OJI97926.1 hypothetical protein ASPVEDRAFT_79602 [Aspergillus versicolor CBS 583.65]
MSSQSEPGRDYVTAGYLTKEKTPLTLKHPPFNKNDAVNLVTYLIQYLHGQGCTYYGITCGYRVPEQKWQFCAWYTMPGITDEKATSIRTELLKYSAGPAKCDGLAVNGPFNPRSFYSAEMSEVQWRYVTKVAVCGPSVFVNRDNDERNVNEMFDLRIVDSEIYDMDRPGSTLETILDVLTYRNEKPWAVNPVYVSKGY